MSIEVRERVTQLYDRLVIIHNNMLQIDGHCKSGEPHITIGYEVDGYRRSQWVCEIYSYTIPLDDGTGTGSGRHYAWCDDTFQALYERVDGAIRLVEDNKQTGGGAQC